MIINWGFNQLRGHKGANITLFEIHAKYSRALMIKNRKKGWSKVFFMVDFE